MLIRVEDGDHRNKETDKVSNSPDRNNNYQQGCRKLKGDSIY
jgi:hypothetical protein